MKPEDLTDADVYDLARRIQHDGTTLPDVKLCDEHARKEKP